MSDHPKPVALPDDWLTEIIRESCRRIAAQEWLDGHNLTCGYCGGRGFFRVRSTLFPCGKCKGKGFAT